MATPTPVEPIREFDLAPPDNARLANLCGPLDENLRLIEDRMAVSVKRRGASFRIAGARAHAAEDVVRDLFEATRHEDVSLERVHLALRDSRDMPGALPVDEPADAGSVRVARGTIRARGRNQRDYLQNIRSKDLSFGIGPAGTGKTYLAVASAVEALQADKIRRIVLTRPAVEAGERLGFLPGDLTQKIDPYLRPIYDALYEMLGFDRVARFIERNVIEVAPLAFMRGRTLNDSYVILDEAQNTTPEQMKMFLTRIGFGSRAVVTGDVSQIDLPKTQLSGLIDAERVLKRVKGIAICRFTSADVVRHPLVARIVDAYDKQRKPGESL
jgi:phosphate starvation-inducible PhoH-like protein